MNCWFFTETTIVDGIGQWELDEGSWGNWLLNWIVGSDTHFGPDNVTLSTISIALDHLFGTDSDVNSSE